MISKPSERKGFGSELANIRILYLSYYMALGAFLPYINLYYERIGLSGIQIGFLSALMLSTMSLASILWGAAADRLHLHRRMSPTRYQEACQLRADPRAHGPEGP